MVIEIKENSLYMVFATDDAGKLYLLHFGNKPYIGSTKVSDDKKRFTATEIQASGCSWDGYRRFDTSCYGDLIYQTHSKMIMRME